MPLSEALNTVGDGLIALSERNFKREQSATDTLRAENFARFQSGLRREEGEIGHKQGLEREDVRFGNEKKLNDDKFDKDLKVAGIRKDADIEVANISANRADARTKTQNDRDDQRGERELNRLSLNDLSKRRGEAEQRLRQLQNDVSRLQAGSARKDSLGNESDPTTGVSWEQALKLNQEQQSAAQMEVRRYNEAYDYEMQKARGTGRDAPPNVGGGKGPSGRGGARKLLAE